MKRVITATREKFNGQPRQRRHSQDILRVPAARGWNESRMSGIVSAGDGEPWYQNRPGGQWQDAFLSRASFRLDAVRRPRRPGKGRHYDRQEQPADDRRG